MREKLTQEQIKKLKKRDKYLIKGAKKGLLFHYPDFIFDRLRPYCIGGMPASIVLFINEMCNGFCYDRSVLMQLALDDCRIVHANIDSLRILGGEEYAEHSFVETTFGGKKWYVIDTSVGLVYDKKYYYKIEHPTINRVYTKEQCMNFREIKQIIASNFEEDKYALPMYLPFIEQAIEDSKHIGTVFYRDKVKKELELFKKAINYDAICAEIEDDMKLMRTNPKALDEKFKIEKDRYGREISRNGVVNPYYKSPEQLDEQEARFKSIKGDEQKEKDFYAEIFCESLKIMEEEDKKTSLKAERRLKQIKEAPTANFYDERVK